MSPKTVKVIVLLVVLVVTAAGCAKPTGDPARVQISHDLPAAVVIVTSQPRADLPAIRTLTAGSACPREHLEVVYPNYSAGRVLVSAIAPPAPTMTGPPAPRKPPGDPTQYQLDIYKHQFQLYRAKLEADRRTLEHILARLLGRWAGSAVATVAAHAPAISTNLRFRAGLSDAKAFFSSLDQARTQLGTRKVIVLFATEATTDSVLPLQPGSLRGITVIIADFKGGHVRQAKWLADLHRAGAARAAVLVPAATSQLPAIVRQALGGCE